jgi:hypothetical protein
MSGTCGKKRDEKQPATYIRYEKQNPEGRQHLGNPGLIEG